MKSKCGAFVKQTKLNEDTTELDNKIANLRETKEKDTKRLEELKRALQNEIQNKARNEEEVREIFKQRDFKRKKESQSDDNARIIQFFYEDWFRQVGQFQKRTGKKTPK